MGRFKAGLCSVSFRGSSARQILEAASAAGLEYIEWGSDVHAPCSESDTLEKIAFLQKTYGITCSSYGTYFRLGQNDLSELGDYIDAAKILGTNQLRLWCGAKGSATFTHEEKTELFDTCLRAAKIAEAAKVVLSMECHQWTFTDTAESIEELMAAVNSPNFRMYWQPNQYRTVAENISHAKETGRYVTNIHVFNWEGDKRYPLEDSIDTWCKYLSEIEGEHTLLLEFLPDDNIDSLKTEALALGKIIDRVR